MHIGYAQRLAVGCMRLSTADDRDEDRAAEVLRAAFEAGLTFLDTADAYCCDDRDVGHNERLIARALAGWTGDRTSIRIATKGGLTRPGGRWVADGRARVNGQASLVGHQDHEPHERRWGAAGPR